MIRIGNFTDKVSLNFFNPPPTDALQGKNHVANWGSILQNIIMLTNLIV